MVTEGREMRKEDMSIIQTQDVKTLAMSEDMTRKGTYLENHSEASLYW